MEQIQLLSTIFDAACFLLKNYSAFGDKISIQGKPFLRQVIEQSAQAKIDACLVDCEPDRKK